MKRSTSTAASHMMVPPSSSQNAAQTAAPAPSTPPALWLRGLTPRGALSRLLFVALTVTIILAAAVCLIDAVRWVDQPFPGFLLNERMIPVNMGRAEWTGPQAGLRYPDRIVRANSIQVSSVGELQKIVRNTGVGEAIVYAVERDGRAFEVSVQTMRFTWSDLLLIFGPTFLAGLIYLVIAVVVYFIKPDAPVTWAFLLSCLSISLYQITTFDTASTHRVVRLTLFLYALIPAAAFHLSLLFPERSRLLDRFRYAPAVPYVISALLMVLLQWLYPRAAFVPVYALVRLYLFLGIIAVLLAAFRAFFRPSSTLARQRAKVVLFGAAVAFPLPGIVNNLSLLGSTPPAVQLLNTLLPLPLLIFPASISYAIARHNLFDVDVYIKRTVGYAIMTAIVGMGYFSMESLTATVILKPVLGEFAQKASPILFALLVVLLFNPVHRRVQDLVDKTFYRKRFDYKQVINSVGNALTSVVALGDIITRIISIIRKEMFIDAAGVIVLDQEKQACQTFMIGDGASPVRDSTKEVCMTPDDPLLLLLSQEKKLITKYDIAEDPRYVSVRQPCGQRFADLGASLAIPLIYQDRLTGVLALGYKKSGHFYTREDVDALKTIADQGAVAIEQARLFEEAKLAEVVRLLGDIGHDLKNLLQPVVSGTWLLKGELDEVFAGLPTLDPGKAQASQELCDEAIGMIRRTSDRIHDRVKEIADCVKGLSAPPQFKACKVAGVVEDVLQTLRVLAAEKDVSLHCKDLDSLPTILADERRLYNAFYNLVNNAIPEVPKGGSITLSGRADPAAGVIHVSVADTGRGMPPEVRERLFTRRAVSTKATGTGLGTKIVKDVVDAHRGQITVESELGVGTTFHLRLPLDPTGPQPA